MFTTFCLRGKSERRFLTIWAYPAASTVWEQIINQI